MGVDVAATEAALDALVARVQDAARGAAHDSAEEVQKTTQGLLTALEHPFSTKTPSPPGSPPAKISGDLAGSVLVTDEGDSSFVGPTTDYGRIQELGGYMQGHPMMHWQEPPGVWHHSAGHDLPERPYLKPALEESLPEIERIYEDAVARAIEESG